jgi:hypothetical protein
VKLRALLLPPAAVLLGACSTANIAVNKNFDYAKVRRVAVVGFKDHARRAGSGDVMTSAFEQSLLSAGFDVIDRAAVSAAVGARPGTLDAKAAKIAASKLGVDALVMGQITDFADARATTVQVDVMKDYDEPIVEHRVLHEVDSNGVPMDVVQDVVIGHRHRHGYRKEPRSYTVPGKLEVTARMVYPASGAMVWSGTNATDGVYPDAARGLTDDILKAAKAAWPKK